jgi:branched-chain amino acid transport system ATP-binding protein
MPHDLELVGVHAGYGEMPALFGVDLAVPAGTVTALLGPNGAGKTTTLRVATGGLMPSKGKVRYRGADVTRSGVRDLATRGLCMIPEGRGIFPTLTVRENLRVQSHLKGRGSEAHIQEVAYSRFPVLGSRRSQVAGTLSGGEQQMLALSRALTTEPSMILLDEISMGLAPLIVEELLGVVRQLASEGLTILLVEQLVQDALDIADYVYVLNQGRIIAVGEPIDVRETIVSSYLGGAGGTEAAAHAHTAPLGEQRPADDVGGLVLTAEGRLAHRRSCPVTRFAGGSRAAPDGAPTCRLCEDPPAELATA